MSEAGHTVPPSPEMKVCASLRYAAPHAAAAPPRLVALRAAALRAAFACARVHRASCGARSPFCFFARAATTAVPRCAHKRAAPQRLHAHAPNRFTFSRFIPNRFAIQMIIDALGPLLEDSSFTFRPCRSLHVEDPQVPPRQRAPEAGPLLSPCPAASCALGPSRPRSCCFTLSLSVQLLCTRPLCLSRSHAQPLYRRRTAWRA